MIDAITYTRGKTNTASAISLVRSMFNANYGDRSNVPNIAILVSDGQPTVDIQNTLPQAIQVGIIDRSFFYRWPSCVSVREQD